MKPQAGLVYRLKINLDGTKPPIWRRVETKDCSLEKLHAVIQIAMGWEFSHLWAFDVGRESFSDDADPELGWRSASRLKLSQIAETGFKKFRYTYDMGDNWQHTVTVEKATEAEPGVKYPRCVDGALACPPEDCGGVWGYYDFLEAIRNPEHDSHEDMLEWIGGEFDPEHFDIDSVNKDLSRLR